MLRTTHLPTYVPTFSPFTHSRKTTLHKKSNSSPHICSFVRSQTATPGLKYPVFLRTRWRGSAVRCGAVRCCPQAATSRHSAPNPDTRARKSSGQCTRHMTAVEGLHAGRCCVGGWRAWRFLALVSSRRRLSAYVYMRVRDVCRRGGCRAGRLGVLVYGG
jgi:hypothetical protein